MGDKSITGIDVGFSWHKQISRTMTRIANGSPRFEEEDMVQPSIVGEPVDVYPDSIQKDDIRYREFEDDGTTVKRELFIGKMAANHSKVKYATKGNDKAETWTTKVLIKTALALTSPNTQTKVVSSLPYDFYFKQEAAFKAMLESINTEPAYEVQIGKTKSIRNQALILKNKLVPQGYAAAMDFLFDNNGKIWPDRVKDAARENLVIDIGFNNLGLIVIDGMQPSTRSKSPDDMGITKVYETMQGVIKKQIGQAPDLYDMDRYVLKGTYSDIDIWPLMEAAFKIYADLLQMQIDSFNTRFNKYILSGGWAHKVMDKLSIPSDRMVVVGQMANARGNLKIGARLWQNGEYGESTNVSD